ncbi:MAG: tetratricopeptide repeat protein [Proteobacteria bacterium]|nr:tetratricopeptide repeat protein [Pseudomonadota bacterium]
MKRSLAIAMFAATMLFPGASWADNEDFGKSAVAQSLAKQASGMDNLPSREISAPKPASPYSYREEIPEDVDGLMASVEVQNGLLVKEFEALLEKDPTNPDAPKWLSQIAEFHWQMAHYAYLRERRAWLGALDSCADDEQKCPPEPVADYHAAIDDYRRILLKYPTYEHLDDVLFRLGDALIRNQQSKEGISYLHRLTQNYPDYKDLDAAYLAIGEFYFSQRNTGTAQAAYQMILDRYPQSSYYHYAQYKLAWTYLNLADEDSYRTAISLFQKVVESIDSRYASAVDAEGQIDENKLKSGEISFRNQALNDLSTTYVELPDGWMQARAYLRTKLPEDKARDKIEQLGRILDSQGKYEEEIELYSDLLKETPKHPHAVDWHIARIEALKASNRLAEAETATRMAIDDLLPGNAWHEANRGQNGSAIAKARKFSAYQIYVLAIAAIEKAEKQPAASEGQDALWADAETLLRKEIAHYAEGDSAFDIYYSFAYVLDERSDGALNRIKKQYGKRLKSEPDLAGDVLVRLREAAGAYQKVVDWPGIDSASERGAQVKVAANRQVFVYANILATSDPEWSIVNSAKAQNFVEEKRGSEVLAAEPLTDAEKGFVRSAEQYAERYPKDDETPAFLWRAAEIYRTHNDYNQAASRFDQIVTNFPDHQYAAVAVGSMFELYHKAKNYEKIEYWAKWLIEHKNFKHYTASELEDTASFAIDRQAVQYADAGKIDDAVSTILRIESSYPERREHVTAARLKAAAFEESRQGWKAAVTLLEPLMAQADTPDHRAHALYRSGVDLMKLARFEEAAERFDRSASAGVELADAEVKKPAPDDKKKSKKAAKPQKAASAESAVPETGLSHERRLETAQSVLYGAQIYRNIGKKDRAGALIDRYLDSPRAELFSLYRVGDSPKFEQELTDSERSGASAMLTRMTAVMERASLEEADLAAERLGKVMSADGFTSQSASLQRMVMLQYAQYALDAGKYEDAQRVLGRMTPDENSWARVELARYAYMNGRIAQHEFDDVVLEFPIRTLRKRIEQKAKNRQAAEKHYQQAIGYKNAQVSTASAYALAEMALAFRDAFKSLPPPKELENDPDGLDEYTTWIEDELIFPAEDAAASLLDVARQITVQLESYTPQALQSAEALGALKPDLYPVTRASVVE